MVNKVSISNSMFLERKCAEKDIPPKATHLLEAAILLELDGESHTVRVDIDDSDNQALFILMGTKGKTATYAFEELIKLN